MSTEKVSVNLDQKVIEELTPRPAAVLMQFLLLYKRNILIARRSYVSGLVLGDIRNNIENFADDICK